MTEIRSITPTVDDKAEFLEIVHDFADPLEVLREAISNAIDAKATTISVHMTTEEIDGHKKLVIEIEDDGTGMSERVVETAFWGLGHSPSRYRKDAIGEKGHGTKIYLRSERVVLRTQTETAAVYSECVQPLRALTRGTLHEPKISTIEPFRIGTGTHLRIEGYNDNERSQFTQDRVRDYVLWFTKFGSVERQFDETRLDALKLSIKCLDREVPEIIPFGHVFPNETADITALFDEHSTEAAERYVKKYVRRGRLENHPEVKYDVVIYVEGDKAKREYNPMLRDRGRKSSGTYRVSDRYGLWLCKDYIPVMRVNEWVTGFGGGSNAFVLLHAFVNCQELRLTANRGSIANTDPKILQELRETVAEFIEVVDNDLNRNDFYTLVQWGHEERTLDQEREEFKRRVKGITKRKKTVLDGQPIFQPTNESELFGLFMTVYAKRPNLFQFVPIDYNTTKGVDVIAQSKTTVSSGEESFKYVELKYLLKSDINHSFSNLRWILCWDFDARVSDETKFTSIEQGDDRQLVIIEEDGLRSYFLDNKRKHAKIEVIRLKEVLEREGIVFV